MSREEALRYSELLKAYGEGKTIQVKSKIGTKWLDTLEPRFEFLYNEYRIKPEPKYIPFTFEDSKLFRDKWVYLKAQKTLTRIIHIQDDLIRSVTIGTGEYFSYSELLRSFEFEDGSPCGKYVEE